MDQDLEKLMQQIEAKQANGGGIQSPPPVVVESPATVAPVQETPIITNPNLFEEKVEQPLVPTKVDKVVDELVTQAVIHKVSSDETVQEEILDTAEKVVTNKIKAVENRAEKESKEAYFDANKDACTIFGYDERTTARSHVKMMKGWAYFLNTLYICTFGFFVVAPIIFICKKLKVLIKQVWVAALVAVLIYLAIIVTPILIAKLSSCSDTQSEEVLPENNSPEESGLIIGELI